MRFLTILPLAASSATAGYCIARRSPPFCAARRIPAASAGSFLYPLALGGPMSCSLCAIVSGDADAHRVYEGEDVVAFLDQNPAVRGHALVVPRDHDADPLDGEGDAVAEATRRVARALEAALDRDGVSVFYTTPTLVGDVTHPHVHVLPRDQGDDVHLALERSALDDDAGALAERVRERV